MDCTIIYGKFYYKNSHFSGSNRGKLIMVEEGWGEGPGAVKLLSDSYQTSFPLGKRI